MRTTKYIFRISFQELQTTKIKTYFLNVCRNEKKKMFWTGVAEKKIANVIIIGVLHRLYQGTLYFRDVSVTVHA